MNNRGTSDNEPDLYVNVSVANIHRSPSFASEMVTQALLGERLKVEGRKPGWCHVTQWDGYRGWIPDFFAAEASNDYIEKANSGDTFVVDDLFGEVHLEDSESSPVVRDLVYRNTLVSMDRRRGWTRVLLPDGQSGWTDARPMEDVWEDLRGYLVDEARRFLGIQYCWGGKSPKGFDCSGFIQTVTKSVIPLPRDAHQQAEHPGLEDISLQEISEGDLLFFARDGHDIDHVAISVGGEEFIHCSGFVKIESFQREAPAYNGRLHVRFRAAKSIGRYCR
ncbi:MAG: NlpC/P60 family protein [Fidelibacterota bacterium]